YTVIVNNGLSVTPSKNMVKNIGFTKDATHGAYINRKVIENPVHELEVRKHPDFFIPHIHNDNYQIKVVFEFSFLRRVKNKIIKTLFYRH
ncbi:MAG TPA: hypothetical protein VL947_08755, partial [Cytophagales bacterium]|nr:hypothetical protein [Cytophagales bacterium]